MPAEIEGYKVFHKDWTCRGKQYSCPGEFEEDVELKLCESGMHFCPDLYDCFTYYPFSPMNHVAKVVSYGDVNLHGDMVYSRGVHKKYCTNKLRIIKEVSFLETIDIIIKSLEDRADDIEMNLSLLDEYKHSDLENIFKTISLYRQTQSYQDDIISFINSVNDSFSSILDTDKVDTDKDILIDIRPESNIIIFYFSEQLLYLSRQHLSNFFTTLKINKTQDIVPKFVESLKNSYLRNKIKFPILYK